MADSRAIAGKKDSKKRDLGGRDRRLRSAAPTAVPTAMHNALPGGQPLPTDMRDEMERHFGETFADVRIHVGAEAAASAAARGASAYTIGSHIVFGHERWGPGTAKGNALLAHELAHVMQQRKSAYMPVATGQSLEADADRAAAAQQRGADVGLAAAAGSVQCAPEEEKSDIRIIPDPGAGKVRVVRVDKQGKIIAGLAEITPAPGEITQTDRVSATREQAAGAKPRYVVGVPEGWKGTKNPGASVSLEASDEVNFSGVSITSGNEEDRFNTDEAVIQFLEDTSPSIAMYFSHGSELSGIRESKEFAAWKKMKAAKRQQEQQQAQTESENQYYQMALYRQSGQMYSGAEAREIWETYNRDSATEWESERIASNTLPNEIRDEKDGTLLGYRLYEAKEKYLAGGVGTITEITLNREGKEVHREETTVLTPATDFFQGVVRGAPVTGNIINAAESGGLSLDLRDPGRFLSEGERLDRAINAVPLADTTRSAMEAATGVSLADKDLDTYLKGEVRLLTDRERAGKASLLLVEGAGAALGARIKIKPTLKLKAPDAPKLKKPIRAGHRPPRPAQQHLPSSPVKQPPRSDTASPHSPVPASAAPTKGESPAVKAAPLQGAKRPPVSAQTRKQQQGLKNVEPGKSGPIPIERARRASPKEPPPSEPQAIKREATNDAPISGRPDGAKLELVHDASKGARDANRTRASAAGHGSGGNRNTPAQAKLGKPVQNAGAAHGRAASAPGGTAKKMPAENRGIPPEVIDDTLAELSKENPFLLGVGRRRAQQIQSGERDFALDQPIAFHVDEPLAVGAPGIKPQRRVKRALDPHNRQLLDPPTNVVFKHVRTNPTDIARGRQRLPPVSVTRDPAAVFTRRFDEVIELRRVFDQAVARIGNARALSATELKARINANVRDIIENGRSVEGLMVRDALTAHGFEFQPRRGIVAIRQSTPVGRHRIAVEGDSTPGTGADAPPQRARIADPEDSARRSAASEHEALAEIEADAASTAGQKKKRLTPP